MKKRILSIAAPVSALALFSAAAFAGLATALGWREALALTLLADLCGAACMAIRILWHRPEYAAFLKYMLIGVATTAVNYVCYWLLAHPLRQALGIEPSHTAWVAFSTAVSWLAAVVFSFFPNKTYAFGSHDWSRQTLVREGRTFFPFAPAHIRVRPGFHDGRRALGHARYAGEDSFQHCGGDRELRHQ